MKQLEVGILVKAAIDGSVRKVGQTAKAVRGESTRLARSERDLGRAGDDAARSTTRLGGALATTGRQAVGMARNAAAATRQVGALNRIAGSAGRALDRVGNRWTGFLTGAGAVGAVRWIGNLQRRFTRLGIQANIGAEEVEALKREIYAVSQQPDIRIDPGEVTAGVERIIEKTGDLKRARDNIENIALVIQATGAAGADAGAMIADMAEKFDIRTAEDMRAALDTMVRQGKAGAFTLQNLAAQGERVMSSYAALGRSGADALREMGALVQMARKGTGSAEQAATAFERMMSEIASKAEDLEGIGVTIWDEDKLAQGQKVARSAVDIIKDLMVETGGDIQQLGAIFGDESIRLLNAIKVEYQNSGAFESLDGFMKIAGDGKQLMEDSARAARDTNAALTNLATAWKSFAETKISGPIQDLADLMNAMSPEAVNAIFKVATASVAVLGAAVIGRKLYGVGAGIARMVGIGGRSAGIGGAALAAAGAGGATPVMVVNWPGGFGGGATGRRPGNGGMVGGAARGRGVGAATRAVPRTRLGRFAAGVGERVSGAGRSVMSVLPKMPAPVGGALKGAGKLLGRLGAPLMIGMGLLDAASAAGRGDTKGVGGAVGGVGGGLAGAAAGATVGSVVPVVGTLIGALVGGLAGSFGGEGLGRWLGGLFGGDEDKAAKDDGKGGDSTVTRVKHDNRTISITINPSPGQDPEAIAAEVQRVLDDADQGDAEELHE